MHTNTAADAPGRLRDLGAPPWLIAATLRLVINQKLVPRLCQNCHRKTGEHIHFVGRDLDGHWLASGCASCAGRGVQSRVAVVESILITPERRALIAQGAQADAFDHSQENRVSIADDLSEKIIIGEVSLEQANIVCGEV